MKKAPIRLNQDFFLFYFISFSKGDIGSKAEQIVSLFTDEMKKNERYEQREEPRIQPFKLIFSIDYRKEINGKVYIYTLNHKIDHTV